MKKLICVSCGFLFVIVSGACSSADLPRTPPDQGDTAIIGRWMRYEFGKQTDWDSSRIVIKRECHGTLNDQEFSLDSASGFFAILLPDPGKKKKYGVAYSTFGLVCVVKSKVTIIEATYLFELRLENTPNRVYVFPPMRFEYTGWSDTSIKNVMSDLSRQGRRSIVREFMDKYPARKGDLEFQMIKTEYQKTKKKGRDI